MLQFQTVLIIGTGLIGSSFASALKASGTAGRILGFDADPAHTRSALMLGHIDEELADHGQIAMADLVLIAVPVSQTANALRLIAPNISPRCCVFDAGSAKRSVKKTAKAILGDKYPQFVPAHPIAGSDRDGPDWASPTLFCNKPCILAPGKSCSRRAFDMAKSAWEACGANVLTMSAAEHDRIFANVSHLPHLLSFAMVAATGAAEKADGTEYFPFAGSGYMDTSRLAGSNPDLWADVCLDNQDHILQALGQAIGSLEDLRSMVLNAKRDDLADYFRKISALRRDLPSKLISKGR